MWPFRSKPKLIPLDRLPVDRVRNELAQLRSQRDDSRVPAGSPLHSWINGAVFALEWAADPYNAVPPSTMAARFKLGLEKVPEGRT